MNVLVLTPDRVGSTLLQRLITIYMNISDFDRPVINLHELTNGLVRYHHNKFDQPVLGKPKEGKQWGYFQTLEEIVTMLDSVTHYKTSRLAHYHIKNRQDPMRDQLSFYQYLNENFFIISAQRDSLLEHALSWGIYTHTKTLNVYDHEQKVQLLQDLYKNKITIPVQTMIKYLNQYVEYLDWVDRHFTVSSYFRYDHDLSNIEQYILNLDFFRSRQQNAWKNKFEIEFSEWNRAHYLLSDLSGLSSQLETLSTVPLLGYSSTAEKKLELQSYSRKEITTSLSQDDRQFLQQHARNYVLSRAKVDDMIADGQLVTGVPIKLQTMLEKRLLIENFDQCVAAYNEWVSRTGIGKSYDQSKFEQDVVTETKNWHSAPMLK